jgi:hypothetical protein
VTGKEGPIRPTLSFEVPLASLGETDIALRRTIMSSIVSLYGGAFRPGRFSNIHLAVKSSLILHIARSGNAQRTPRRLCTLSFSSPDILRTVLRISASDTVRPRSAFQVWTRFSYLSDLISKGLNAKLVSANWLFMHIIIAMIRN